MEMRPGQWCGDEATRASHAAHEHHGATRPSSSSPPPTIVTRPAVTSRASPSKTYRRPYGSVVYHIFLLLLYFVPTHYTRGRLQETRVVLHSYSLGGVLPQARCHSTLIISFVSTFNCHSHSPRSSPSYFLAFSDRVSFSGGLGLLAGASPQLAKQEARRRERWRVGRLLPQLRLLRVE